MAGIEVDEALVLPHIVEAVGDHRAHPRTAEVVVVGLDRFLGVDLAFAVEIAQQFLLLGVHADDWQAGLQILLLQTGDVLELGIAVRIRGPIVFFFNAFRLRYLCLRSNWETTCRLT